MSALAQRARISRPTLYRNHPGLVHDFLAQVADQRQTEPRNQSAATTAEDKLAGLRGENQDLRLHVAHYEDHLRHLMIKNARLREQVANLSNVGDLTAHRLDRHEQGAAQ